MIEFVILSAVFAATVIGVEIFRRWSLRANLLDLPNERSSHKNPTPRGGGIIIAAVCLLAYALISTFLTGKISYYYLCAALLIAAVSWLDDLISVSFAWRLAVQSAAAGIVIYGVGYFETIFNPFGSSLNLGIFGIIVTFFWIVWLTNAYNFMDGIDGIAGVQAVTAGLCWFAGGIIVGDKFGGLYGGVIAAAAAGFLIHNWQPAKIFMGDVGSAFLGFTFAVMPLLFASGNQEMRAKLPVVAMLAMWYFLFDTLLTLGRRTLKKQKVWQAHREHLYQRLTASGKSHAPTTVWYGALSLLNAVLVGLWLSFGDFWLAAVIIASVGGAGLVLRAAQRSSAKVS